MIEQGTSHATISLSLTADFGHPENAEAIRTELNKYLMVDRPMYHFQESVDPAQPSFIQLLGEVALWSPLVIAATVYLKTLAKRAGDATWDGLASLFKSNEVKPLADVATCLAKAVEPVDGKATILVGLNSPDDVFGTVISTDSTDPEEIARVLASFIVHMEELSTIMQAEIEAGRTPIGRVNIELQDDGSLLVKWTMVDASGHWSDYERRIPNMYETK